MSKSNLPTSVEAEGSSEGHSVYDFLYNDNRRVGSFLSQLGEVGHLQQLTRTDISERGSEKTSTLEGKGSLPALASGSVKKAEQASAGASEGSSRVYDPLWSNARALLNYLNDHNLIQRDISAASLGNVVLVSGVMNFVDLGMVKALWTLPTIQRAVHAGEEEAQPFPRGNRQERRAQGKSKPVEPPKDPNTEMMLEILPALPHSISLLLHGSDGTAWGTLDEEHLVGRASDLILKHGASIPGNWNVLGILDAQPDYSNLAELAENQEFDLTKLAGISLIGQVSNMLAPIIQFLLGRPTTAYGITPLMVFRAVEG